MRRRILEVLLVLSFIIVVCFVYYKIRTGDSYNKKMIENLFENRYTASFEYINKGKDEKTGSDIYYYKCIEIDDIIVEGWAGWEFDSPIPLLPFVIARVYNENFYVKLTEYMTDKRCGGTVDITGMDIEQATKHIYDLVSKIDKDIAPYRGDSYVDYGINLLVTYGGKSDEILFNQDKEYIIELHLRELMYE